MNNPRRRPNITDDDRQRVIWAYNNTNWSQRKIASELGIGTYTVSRILAPIKTRGIKNYEQETIENEQD